MMETLLSWPYIQSEKTEAFFTNRVPMVFVLFITANLAL